MTDRIGQLDQVGGLSIWDVNLRWDASLGWKGSPMVSLYDAKTHLSSLVDRAAGGEEIIITKNGRPRARIVPLLVADGDRVPAGALGVVEFHDDFNALDREITSLFNGE